MKMVSAAKLRRAQDAITQMRPYAVKLQAMLSNVSSSLEQGEGQYSEQRDVKRVLVVAITSNRGLCGAFNNNIVKEATKVVKEASEAGRTVEVLPLGKKALDAANRLEWTLAEGYGDVSTTLFDNLDFANASDIANKVMEAYVA
ncbi:MAG: F0F1 ATP synthase subunit gamma, partial [Flavobacteriales bacterium]